MKPFFEFTFCLFFSCVCVCVFAFACFFLLFLMRVLSSAVLVVLCCTFAFTFGLIVNTNGGVHLHAVTERSFVYPVSNRKK